jgi:hypothetical protein
MSELKKCVLDWQGKILINEVPELKLKCIYLNQENGDCSFVNEKFDCCFKFKHKKKEVQE